MPFFEFGLLLDTCGIFRFETPAGCRELPEGLGTRTNGQSGLPGPRSCILFHALPREQGGLWDSGRKPHAGEKKGNASVALFTVV
jgi:hypothetical protein